MSLPIQQPYVPVHEQHFERDLKRMKKSGRKSLEKKFIEVYPLLLNQSLESQMNLLGLKDHALTGEYKGYRELHVQFDWLIIYKVDHMERRVYFARTGTHADLFD